VVAGVRCKPVGTTVAEMQTAARAILRLSEQYAVERALWRGGVWPDTVTAEAGFLAQDPTILSATPVSAKAAVGLLEDGLVQLSGGVGVIHAPRLALGVIASDWPNDALIMATRTVSAGYACGVLGVPVTLA
jgi:hypothetical protein